MSLLCRRTSGRRGRNRPASMRWLSADWLKGALLPPSSLPSLAPSARPQTQRRTCHLSAWMGPGAVPCGRGLEGGTWGLGLHTWQFVVLTLL